MAKGACGYNNGRRQYVNDKWWWTWVDCTTGTLMKEDTHGGVMAPGPGANPSASLGQQLIEKRKQFRGPHAINNQRTVKTETVKALHNIFGTQQAKAAGGGRKKFKKKAAADEAVARWCARRRHQDDPRCRILFGS